MVFGAQSMVECGAWLLKFSLHVKEVILMQRNALVGTKKQAVQKSVYQYEPWIQAIIGWLLLSYIEAYRRLMKT